MSTYYASLLADVGILTLGALSVYIILATGQLSLGNAGFMAIGAYLTSYLTVRSGLALTPALLIAAVTSGLIGVLVGFPALRLKGLYLAMATLGFGEMMRSLFLNLAATGGAEGFHGMAHVSVAYIWIWVGLILLLVWLMESSRLWLEMRAIADDETAADTSSASFSEGSPGSLTLMDSSSGDDPAVGRRAVRRIRRQPRAAYAGARKS